MEDLPTESSWMDALSYVVPILVILGGYWYFTNSKPKTPIRVAPLVNKKPLERRKAVKLEGRPIKLFYGSQTGTAEDFAHKISAESKKFKFAPEVVDLEEYEKETLAEEKFVVFFMATYGEGEPTDNAREFYEWLMSPDREVGSLSGVQFSVFGLGNKTYEHYNSMGRRVNEQMEKLGAQRIYQYGEGDDDASLEDDFGAWKKDLWPTVCKHFGMEIDLSLLDSAAERRFKMNQWSVESKQHESAQKMATRHLCKKGDTASEKAISVATVKVNRELHTEKSDRSCHHLEIELAPGVTYTAGDHLAIYPENDKEMVRLLALRLGVDLQTSFSLVAEKDGRTFLGPCTFGQVLTQWSDITSPPRKSLLKILAGYTQDAEEKRRLLELSDDSKPEPYGKYIKDDQRTLLEILEEFKGVKVPIDHLIEVLPRLAPRYYSISSSLKAHPGRVHVTSVVVQFETPTKREHKGVCSSWLSTLVPEFPIYVFVRDSGFRLPKDPKTPVIMVGPGTGLAPFRGFIQDRKQTPDSGEMVLFFGCRSPEIDYIYRDELEEAEKAANLKLITAFSRATQNKVYVHHKMLENSELVWKLLEEQKAYFYVCGDARVMAKDVKNALVKIATTTGGKSAEEAEKYVENLIKEQRYQTDVWF